MRLLLRSARRFGVPALGAVVLVAAGFGAVPVVAQETLPEVEVIGVTPMPGTGVARDRVPAAVQTITDEDIDALQPRNLTDLVEQTLRGVSVTDVQNSPYQQNLSYRGFTLSPLLGEAQGIAVYLNGVRVNEGFGDTMQWDLVPEAAIRRLDLVGGNPAYGLNALGGALSLQTHTGLSFSGSEFEIKGGSHGRLDTSVQAGGKLNETGVYVAAERGEEDGWRDNSDSSILRLYGDATHLFERGSLGFSALFARTEITGNGATPEDLLGIRRESVFTYPDITENDLTMVSLRGDYEISDNVRISGVMYHRDLHRDTINGDEFDGYFDDEGYLLSGELEEEEEEEEEPAFFFGHVLGGDEEDLSAIKFDLDSEQAAIARIVREDDDDDDDDDDNGDDDNGDDHADNGDDDDEGVAYPGARNLTSTDTTTQGLSLQADLTSGSHQVAIGMTYDQSDTVFNGMTLAGLLQPDRNVPALRVDGNAYVLTNVCEEDEFEEDDGECEELEDSEAGPLHVDSDTQAWGLYVSDTMALSGRTDLTFSGRYNHVEVGLTIDERARETHSFGRFNPAVGITHRVSDGLSLYGGYREANRAPTAAELGCADPAEPCRLPNAFVADPPLDQVVTRSVEAGLRGRMATAAGPVAWELGSYASVNEDDIIFVAVGESPEGQELQPGLGYFDNFGQTRRIGFDGQVGGRMDSWDWNANYSYVQATFNDSKALPGANHDPSLVADAACAAFDDEEEAEEASVICVEPGDRIPGVPEHSVKVGIGYTLDNGLRIGTNLVARSGVYLRGDESNLLAETDGYGIVNLTLDWSMGSFTVFGRIENLLGTDYETFGIVGECEYEGDEDECEGEVPIIGHGLEEDVHHTNRFLSPGAPQSFYIGMRYRF